MKDCSGADTIKGGPPTVPNPGAESTPGDPQPPPNPGFGLGRKLLQNAIRELLRPLRSFRLPLTPL